MNIEKLFVNTCTKEEATFDDNYLDFFEHVPNFIPGYPAVDIKENKESYILEVELPGLIQKDIEIYLSNNLIILRSKNNQDYSTHDYNYLVLERRKNNISRSFSLPKDIDVDNTKAVYKNGLLILNLPKLKK